MAEAKHTPGPWLFEPHNGYGAKDPDGEPWPFGYISTAHPSPIFELSTPLVFPHEELVANARLIAAAPDLLAACQAVLGEWRDGYGLDCIEQLRAAIAKAEGRA
jgi:hypothetical protein